jgi:uncharacterized protein (TIGR02444 family)
MKQVASSGGAKMSAPSDHDGIWDFALRWYAIDGVQADCLMAQDRYGLDVTVLIFALYRAKLGQGFDAGLAVELARTVSARVIEPLRSARTALKSLPRLIDDTAATHLREQVKASELAAERLLLEALAQLPIHDDLLSCEQAIVSVARAGQASDEADLRVLLKRLAMCAQHM